MRRPEPTPNNNPKCAPKLTPKYAPTTLPHLQACRQAQVLGLRGGVGEAAFEECHRCGAQGLHGLADRGERRLDVPAEADAVEPDDGDIMRYPDAAFTQGGDDPDGHLVVGAHDRIGQLHVSQRIYRSSPGVLGEITLEGITEWQSRGGDHGAERVQPLTAVG